VSASRVSLITEVTDDFTVNEFFEFCGEVLLAQIELLNSCRTKPGDHWDLIYSQQIQHTDR
jgi:hypothetical protein